MKLEIIKTVRQQHGTLLPGEYVGTYCGYIIELPLQTETWILHTKEGIRGRCQVRVMVDEQGKMEVKMETSAVQ